jgi:hypothetical protein
MKMNENVFTQLSQDFHTVLTEYFRGSISDDPKESMIDAWVVFHEVCAQRSYDDTHPRWEHNDRVLSPDWSEKWNMNGNQTGYLAWVYDNKGDPIHDDHIHTALKKIISQYHKA